MGKPCPSCHFRNIPGADRCEQCLYSLMQTDLPKPKKTDQLQRTILTAPVTEIITGKDLLVASPSDSLSKIVKIFQKEKKSCVIIYQRKKLVGILSKRDLLKKLAGKVKELGKAKVKDYMTPHPETVRPNDSIACVVNKMAMGGFRQVPVLREDGTPMSIITIKDVFTYLSGSA